MENARETAIDMIEFLLDNDYLDRSEYYYRATGMIIMAYKLKAITEAEKEVYLDRAAEIFRKNNKF